MQNLQRVYLSRALCDVISRDWENEEEPVLVELKPPGAAKTAREEAARVFGLCETLCVFFMNQTFCFASKPVYPNTQKT